MCWRKIPRQNLVCLWRRDKNKYQQISQQQKFNHILFPLLSSPFKRHFDTAVKSHHSKILILKWKDKIGENTYKIGQLSLYANSLYKVVRKKLNTPIERWSKEVNTIDPHCSWIPFKINAHSAFEIIQGHAQSGKQFESLGMHVLGGGPTRARSAFLFQFWFCKQVTLLQPI